MARMKLRLGTRASPLAQWQARWVSGQLEPLGVDVCLVPMATPGDVRPTGPIGEIGGQGVFTKTIQQALLAGAVDLAVHSLKDLPTEPVAGLTLAAVPARAAVRDALVSRDGSELDALAAAAVVGTGSLRRRTQLLHARADLIVRDLRGNVETRLGKLDHGDYDAVVLAVAGLERLGLGTRITQTLPAAVVMPAVGQGALGIETRAEDTAAIKATAALDHGPTRQAVTAERAMLAALRGGCQAPVGAWSRTVDGRLHLAAVVLSRDGGRRLEAHAAAPPDAATELGQQVAQQLVAGGANALIAEARQRQ